MNDAQGTKMEKCAQYIVNTFAACAFAAAAYGMVDLGYTLFVGSGHHQQQTAALDWKVSVKWLELDHLLSEIRSHPSSTDELVDKLNASLAEYKTFMSSVDTVELEKYRCKDDRLGKRLLIDYLFLFPLGLFGAWVVYRDKRNERKCKQEKPLADGGNEK